MTRQTQRRQPTVSHRTPAGGAQGGARRTHRHRGGIDRRLSQLKRTLLRSMETMLAPGADDRQCRGGKPGVWWAARCRPLPRSRRRTVRRRIRQPRRRGSRGAAGAGRDRNRSPGGRCGLRSEAGRRRAALAARCLVSLRSCPTHMGRGSSWLYRDQGGEPCPGPGTPPNWGLQQRYWTAGTLEVSWCRARPACVLRSATTKRAARSCKRC